MANEGFLLLNNYALIVLIILSIVFFGKNRMHNIEDETYGKLLTVSIITILFGLILGIFLDLDSAYKNISIIIFNKLYLIGLIFTISTFAFYTFCITYSDEKKIKLFNRIYVLLGNLNALIVILLPLSVKNNNGSTTVEGLAMNYTYMFFAFVYFLLIVLMLINIKKIRNRKYIPVIILIFEGILIMLIQIFYPQLNYIINPSTVITCLVMYFTIENPDVKMIEQLNIAKDTAEKANRAKSDFLSSMSHEIRTPLNAIVGFSECIINADSLEEAKDNANDVVTASNTLLEIVNGILDISKIEAGKLELIENDYDTQKLFNDVIKLIRVRIGDKPLDFRVSIAEDLPPVLYGDHGNVKKILINLLTNAVKYTDNGYINLNVKCVKTEQICRLIVSVKDTGRGIKKEDIAKLFTKFQRVDEDRNTTIEGTGLGLAITKQLVQMMNGNIVVNSVYGEGSEFTVAIDQRLSLAKIEVEKNDITDFNLDLTGKKILIVDDNKLNIKVAEKIIAKYNPIIDSCESGFECLEKVKINKYDLILLDDMMPKMRGSEVLVKLKEDPNFNTPVIVLTANAINGMEEQYLSKGFNGYLAKPIEKDKLFYILNKYLGNNKNQSLNNNDNICKEAITENNNKNNINYLKDNGINIDSALELLGDCETYNEILKEYVNSINDKITNLTNFKNNNDMENYVDI